jgi:hypothetical protein
MAWDMVVSRQRVLISSSELDRDMSLKERHVYTFAPNIHDWTIAIPPKLLNYPNQTDISVAGLFAGGASALGSGTGFEMSPGLSSLLAGFEAFLGFCDHKPFCVAN